jgi:hypothetical protein
MMRLLVTFHSLPHAFFPLLTPSPFFRPPSLPPSFPPSFLPPSLPPSLPSYPANMLGINYGNAGLGPPFYF